MKSSIVFLFIVAATTPALAVPPWQARDLNPVTIKHAPGHAPVVLVKDGQARASIVVMKGAAGASDLQKYIKLATAAELPIVRDKLVRPAIVLGDCPEAAALGLVGERMPPEAFAIKTGPELVFIAGNDAGRNANGVQWGVSEFLERFVGMRWYFPPATEDGPDIGQSIPASRDLTVPPVWLEDAPAFRMRELWPPVSDSWHGRGIRMGPLHTFLRSGNSWPIKLRVHAPNWSRHDDLKRSRPEVYQMRKDGSRQHGVLCYGHPKTLHTYLEGIQDFLAGRKPAYAPIVGKSITVSPADVELACYCPHCRKLWDDDGGQYGGASKVMATFVDRLARAVQRHWPDEGFTIIYLPYLNYTTAPAGFKFPDNVQIQVCGMPGLATHKEPAIRQAEQANIDRWIAISGRPIENWHYCCWPAHKTKAAYQYPHVVQQFYRDNRRKTVGTFINGTGNHWPRQHISLYCWLKVLWDPEFDVDAAIDEFCRRMFGSAAATMRQLVGMQIDGWEKSRWPGGRFSPKGIYEASYPPDSIAKMKQLYASARQQAGKDALVMARLDYYAPALEAFFQEADVMSGRGFKPLTAQKVGESPTLDGKLNDKQWQRAAPNGFVIASGKDQGKPARYPTTVRAVWTTDGITFGFHMREPTPHLLETVHGGHDNGLLWWDDNVELLLDVTGASEGEFYHFIVNPNIDYWDAKLKDTTWECREFAAKAHRGKDFWSLEVFLPYAAFPEAKRPGSGSETVWTGNFTRHRVADRSLNSAKPRQEGSLREYQRMNTTGAVTSDNLADFSEIRFVE